MRGLSYISYLGYTGYMDSAGAPSSRPDCGAEVVPTGKAGAYTWVRICAVIVRLLKLPLRAVDAELIEEERQNVRLFRHPILQ